MTSEVWALIGVVVGSLLGGVAQVAAGALQARTARRNRRYEERRTAYSNLLNALRDQIAAIRQVTDLYEKKSTDVEANKRAELELTTHSRAYWQAETNLWIFGSPDIIAAADTQLEAVRRDLRVVLDHGDDPLDVATFQKTLNGFGLAEKELRVLIRNDLGIEPL